MWAAFRGGAGVGAAGAGRTDWLHLLAWLVPLVGFAVVGLTWMGSDWWHLRLGLECALLASLAAGGPLLLCWERRGRVLRGWLLWLAIAAGLALAPVLMFELWPRPGLTREPLGGLRQAVGALVGAGAAPPLGREVHVLLISAAFAAATSACLSLALAAALLMPSGRPRDLWLAVAPACFALLVAIPLWSWARELWNHSAHAIEVAPRLMASLPIALIAVLIAARVRAAG